MPAAKRGSSAHKGVRLPRPADSRPLRGVAANSERAALNAANAEAPPAPRLKPTAHDAVAWPSPFPFPISASKMSIMPFQTSACGTRAMSSTIHFGVNLFGANAEIVRQRRAARYLRSYTTDYNFCPIERLFGLGCSYRLLIAISLCQIQDMARRVHPK